MGRMPWEWGGWATTLLSSGAVWGMVRLGAHQAYPNGGIMQLVRRARYSWRAWRERHAWQPLREAAPESALGHRIQQRSGLAHMLAWPYIHCAWSVRQRVDTLVAHYEMIELWPWMHVPEEQRRAIARLNLPEFPGLTLQLERPQCFAQEGELTLSLYEDNTRLYSVMFSFGWRGGRRVAFVGAIQGRSLPGANERYAALTKAMHGCRPRDLVVQALQFVCEAIGIERLLAVSDACRHHRDPARWRRLELPSADYDEVWRDRGGVPTEDGFFEIDTAYAPRALETVAAKKRAMYRRRQEFLGHFRDDIHHLARANLDWTTQPV